MKIDMDVNPNIVSSRGVLKTRSTVASKASVIEMLWEYLHRKSPDRAKKLLKLLMEHTKAEMRGAGSHDTLRAEAEQIINFTVELMEVNYRMFVDRRQQEIDNMLFLEVVDRQYETEYTSLGKIGDEALIESVKLALKDENVLQPN